MSDRVIAVLLVIALTVLMIAAVLGQGPLAGRELFGVTDTHGVHVGDLPFFAAWAVGIVCSWQVWRRGR